MSDDIVSVAVHPSIGVARIGNSPDEWFLATDLRGGTPGDSDGYRDSSGRIKRQVARFRIYATMASGNVKELTADEAEIEWRVEVANLKAGWYQFHYPLDLPVPGVQATERRSPSVADGARNDLDILPSPKSITGTNQSGAAFDDGAFHGKSVPLGELRTDDKGRLLFFGGLGDSSPRVPGTKPDTFANNEDWHDDVCDGPVRARVRIPGKTLDAKPAHVIVAPPNFGPGLFGIVTMDDVVRDTFREQGWLQRPTSTSFTNDVWPIFDRMTGHQWVNDGIFLVAGEGTPLDARNQGVIDRLRDASTDNAGFRQQVHALFRQPGQNSPQKLPPIYGDALGDPVRDASGQIVLIDPTRQELLLTDTQYFNLQNWADGNFADDWSGFPTLPDFDTLSAAEQIEQLDRAGLHECLGGPFHPGIEITWPFRLGIMWEAPYRLNTLPEGERTRQDYGSELTVEDALSPDGPHGSSGPGSLTRWLGVPWQTDEASCNSGLLYSPQLHLSSPSFWGARVPNQVLSQDAYDLMVSPDLTEEQAERQFSSRHLWLRDINGRGYLNRIDSMVTRWWRLGLVEARTPPKGSDWPNPTFVESGRNSGATTDPTLAMIKSVLALNQADAEIAGLSPAAASAEESEDPRGYTTFDRGEI